MHKHFQEGAEARAPAWLLDQTDFQVRTGLKIVSHVFLGKRHRSQAQSGQLPDSWQAGSCSAPGGVEVQRHRPGRGYSLKRGASLFLVMTKSHEESFREQAEKMGKGSLRELRKT